ncbi:MAG TPA: aminotransferase class I/II-fold pyridoxal phosphate-dependent enzyme [Longimicrobiales bacterium]|nr:aminotransferase class I/II-fold pyridoxal phosphate-dependent enzyme [Longimicrobiales bacterium]
MQRRAFVRRSLAVTLAAPAALHLDRATLSATSPARSPDSLGVVPFQRGPARLASNENPLGVPDSARQAIVEAIAEGNRYPRLNARVAEALARRNGVQLDNVVLGNGSAEILQMTVQAASAGGTDVRVIVADPTFEQVERYATAMHARIVKVPLLANWSHDLDGMRAAALASAGPTLVFICNPNNPTGTLTSCDDIAVLLRSLPDDTWFLIDEAYLEYAHDPGYRPFIAEATSRPNTVVSRTFSKIYGLAGIRLGYAIGTADTIARVSDHAAATNINHLATAAALACLDDDAYVDRSLDVNRQGMTFAARTLDELGIEYLPSHANFVMHRIRGELRDYIDGMRENNVNVGRAFPPMLGWNRVSIGLPWEMQAWATALGRMRIRGLA